MTKALAAAVVLTSFSTLIYAADYPGASSAASAQSAPIIHPATAAPIGRTAINAYRALNEPLPELAVDGVALSKVIDFLRDASGANIIVNWRVLETVGVTRDTPITLTVRDLPMRKMLELALDQASAATPLVFSIDSNVIDITTQEEADKKMITRVYPIEDLLLVPNNDFNPAPLGLGQQQEGSGGGSLFQDTQTQQNNVASAAQRGEDLANLVRTVIRPSIWKENGGTASITYFSGKLIVTAPQSVQDAIGGPTSYVPMQRIGG